MVYFANIEDQTLKNTYYRQVLTTGSHMQLVVMSLKPGEEIPQEVHPDIDQFIRVEKGQALVIIDEEEITLNDDDVIVITAGKQHYVKNISDSEDLKIYTIYSPPEHPPNTIHKTKQEADEYEEKHHH